jgi:hypothetical protein
VNVPQVTSVQRIPPLPFSSHVEIRLFTARVAPSCLASSILDIFQMKARPNLYAKSSCIAQVAIIAQVDGGGELSMRTATWQQCTMDVDTDAPLGRMLIRKAQ